MRGSGSETRRNTDTQIGTDLRGRGNNHVIIYAKMKRAPVLALPESGKRPRRGDGDESDSSEEPLEGSSNTKRPEELKAMMWKLCEPAPVKINGKGSIAVQGNTVYVSPHDSNTLYEFNADKGEWVCSIECDRKSFGIAVIKGDLTLVGGKSLTSTLKTLTSLVKNRSGEKWIQKYPPMSECGTNVRCYNDEHLLIVGSGPGNMEVMDVKRKKWKSVKFPNDYGEISAITIVGDRVYVLSQYFYSIDRYSTVSTCSLSALLESAQHSTKTEPLVWHKLHPITDLYRPFLVNISGNLVAIGGRKIQNEYSDGNCRDCIQYSVSPALNMYSDEGSSLGSKGWKFVANLPSEIGYPDMNFLVAALQGDRLIVCGGDQYEDGRTYFSNITDIVHMGLLK